MALRATLRKWHTWLGWIVGIPLLLWVVSGLVMVAKPIEEVRGEHLLTEPAAVRVVRPLIPPAVQGVPLRGLTLEQRADGPRWVVTLRDGTTRLADPATGSLLPPVSAAAAMREVTSRYTGSASVSSVRKTDAQNPPMEWRRPVAAWRVEMSDGTRFYVDSGSGAVAARRTGWWRFYDLMWAFHIMDFDTREPSPNPWILSFGIASLAMAIMALILLPLTIRKRKRQRQLDS